MDVSEVMQQLESLGTEQNRKVFRRHGVRIPLFGVSFADLDKLTKQLRREYKKDLNGLHNLAVQLWHSGNCEARLLASRLADPARLDSDTLDAWAGELDNYGLADAFSGLVGQSPLAQQKMNAWIHADDEWIGTAGWNLVGHLALHDASLPDDFFTPYLEIIEREIHTRKNRVRYAMNGALIAIGTRSQALYPPALSAAGQIGVVDVDHGETNCKTPFAPDYMRKTWEYKEKKAAKN